MRCTFFLVATLGCVDGGMSTGSRGDAECTNSDPFYEAGRCPPGSPIEDAPAGFVLFGKDQQIYRADFDGCGARRVTQCPRETLLSRVPIAASQDGEWFAHVERRVDYRAQLFVSRSDGRDTFVAHGEDLQPGHGTLFLADPPALVFASEERNAAFWLAPLDGGESTPISGSNSSLEATSEDRAVLVFSTIERDLTPAAQQVLWRLDLHPRARLELARIDEIFSYRSAAVTRDGAWVAYTWTSSTAAGGWVAMDATGARVSGDGRFEKLLAPGSGADLVGVGSSTIALLAPPATIARTIYRSPPRRAIVRMLPVPYSRSLLFTEISTAVSSTVADIPGDLLELDLDSGSIKTIAATQDFHSAEYVSEDGRYVLESVFSTWCSLFSNERRTTIVLRDRLTGEQQTLSMDPNAAALGFSSDGHAAILALPLWSDGDPASTNFGRYRIEARMVDSDRSIEIVDYQNDVSAGYATPYGVHLVPQPRAPIYVGGTRYCF
jgi:hypothetical protein